MERKHSPRPGQVISLAAIAKRYDLSVPGLKEWLDSSKYGTLDPASVKQCLPPVLDGYAGQKLASMLKDDHYTDEEIAEYCNREMESTAKRQNKRMHEQ